jgi:hypothetical protein
MVRIKIHPDARVGHFKSMRATSVEIVKWAVEHKYDILELTSTQENKAGIAILNEDSTYLQEARETLDWERLPQDCQQKAEDTFLKHWGRSIQHSQ